MNYPDDILETALSKGIRYAVELYKVDKEYVESLVRTFRDEMEDPNDSLCMCEQSRKNGIPMMCFMCSGPMNRRIHL